MKNFEHYKDVFMRCKGRNLECVASKEILKRKCANNCAICVEFIKKWLYEEYKEPIKLTQFEYDIINYHGRLSKFNDICFLMAMKNKGHFKDMNSVEKCSMTIEEILENCEVVENVG